MRKHVRRSTLFLYIALAAIVASLAVSRYSSWKRGKPKVPGTATALPVEPARAAYVTNNGSDSVSCVERDGDAVHTVSIDMGPEHEAPHHLAIDSRARAVFVALAFPPEPSKKKDPHATHGNASDTGRIVRLDLGSLTLDDTEEVDENPGDVVLTHDRKKLLITHFDMKRAMDVAARGGASPATMFANLLVLESPSMKRAGSRALCVAPHGIVTTRDDRTAYVACYGSDELAVVDLAQDGLPTSRHPLGTMPGVPGVPRYGPYSATLTPDETRVVVCDLEGQDLRVFDRAEKRFVADKTVPLAAKAFMPAFVDDRTVLVPLQSPDGLAKVDLDTARVTLRRTFPKDECALPHVVKIAKDKRAYLVCEGDHRGPGTLLEIDPESLATKKRWSVGVYPDDIAFGDE